MFIPRIPACTVEVLAEAMAPGVETAVLGIRPGEKIHETLITPGESRNVLEYDGYYVVQPTFPWWGDRPREQGRPVEQGFSFSSDQAQQLSVEETAGLLRKLGFLD